MDTTGAGDSFAGGFICATSREWPLDQAVALGQATASLALYSHGPVSPELSMEAVAQPVLLSMRPPPALKPRGQTRVFTQGDKAGIRSSVSDPHFGREEAIIAQEVDQEHEDQRRPF